MPFTNYAYWGPPIRVGLPQRAITVNMGPETNAKLDQAAKDGLGPAMVEGEVQDRSTNQKVPVQTFGSLRPPLASMPSWLVDGPNVRRAAAARERREHASRRWRRRRARWRRRPTRSSSRASSTPAATAACCRRAALVGVRGAGFSYDGLYYVRRVTHKIALGRYTQRFELAREGLGSTTPVVPV